MESTLVGYARKSKAGGAVRLSIDAEAFAKAKQWAAKDGRTYVSLVINSDKMSQILSGEREVTSVVQLHDDAEPAA